MKLNSGTKPRLNDMPRQYPPSYTYQSGFTLIEFVVASALGLMIILAIGGAYVATQRVNETATMRVDRQQELRLASNLLVRDARMAGTFGCANVATFTDNGATKDHSDLDIDQDASYFDANDDRVFATRILLADSDVMSDVMSAIDDTFVAAAGSDMVIFNYGTNSQPLLATTRSGVNQLTGFSLPNGTATNFDANSDSVANSARLVLSSCQRVDILKRNQLTISGEDATLDASLDPIPMYQAGENIKNITGGIGGEGHFASQASLSNLYTVVYVVGKVQGDSQANALYRFELQTNGAWTPPQLLASHVSNLKAEYIYVNNCVVVDNPTVAESYFVSQAAFLEKNNASGHMQVLTPNGVQLKITPSAINTISNASETLTSNNDLQVMVLNAAMRGADACIAE
ncbi:PilW family protein [Vitreoscilla stercoraria]|uniref:Prepilin-type N-terminal cleavage/methylation domain-containing protein n=1 Tax=Vitreoscilla stercoraria TaxID=61 RepID=A0ABY4E838_VITST|nr:hypothetical protein [Vitreoscilla stercoraria]UOO91927.1 hypothetical protein LVJ81_09820 [Vitreoscilla stercoraria]